MSWLTDFFKGHKKQEQQKLAAMLNGYTPVFSQFGQDVYASDVVQQAVSCIVMEMKKLTPQHIRENTPVFGEIQRLLNDPNPIMTQSDFLEKVFWQLFLNYNSFIIPTYTITKNEKGEKIKHYSGLWPVQPSQVDFLEDASGELYIRFTFPSKYTTTLRRSDVIHLKYKFSFNEFMGGNAQGQPDNAALLTLLQLNQTLLEGVGRALKSSFAVNGVIKYNTLLDSGKMEENIAELEAQLQKNTSGLLPLDIKGEFIPITRNIQLVDDATLKFIDEKILRQFGVPLPILMGDYTKAQYEAFYQKTLEPLIKSISQEFTKILFSTRERGRGNKIVFYPHELVFMDTTQKLEMVRLLGDSGALYENEKREAFGLRPLEELVGVRMMSLNYVNVKYASQYQVGGSQNEQEGTTVQA